MTITDQIRLREYEAERYGRRCKQDLKTFKRFLTQNRNSFNISKYARWSAQDAAHAAHEAGLVLNLRELAAHMADDPHCTCPDCIDAHFGQQDEALQTQTKAEADYAREHQDRPVVPADPVCPYCGSVICRES